MPSQTLSIASLLVAALVASLLVCSASSARSDNTAQALQAMHEAALADMLGSAEVPYPSRPNIFKSPFELRQYLDALNAYYAIAGRPRFGKRAGSAAQRSSSQDDLFDY